MGKRLFQPGVRARIVDRHSVKYKINRRVIDRGMDPLSIELEEG